MSETVELCADIIEELEAENSELSSLVEELRQFARDCMGRIKEPGGNFPREIRERAVRLGVAEGTGNGAFWCNS